jgi:tetratricopeptide (TPR) repeat protein
MRFRNRESATDAVAEAQQALREGDGNAYLACTERAVTRFPDDSGVRLEYATALLDSDPGRAGSEALRAVGLERAPEAARLTRAAGLLLSLGETEAARSCAEQAANAGPTNVVIVNRIAAVRGEIAARERDYGSAEHYLRVAHEADPSNPFFALDLARVILASNDHRPRHQDAVEVIDRTLTLACDQSLADREGRRLLEQLRGQVHSAGHESDDEEPSADTPPHEDDLRLDPQPRGRLETPEPAATATSARRRSAADAVVHAQKLHANGQAKQYLAFAERAVSEFPNDAAIRLEHATALAPYSPANAISEARQVSRLEADDELNRTALLLRAGRLAIDLGAIEDAQALADSAAEGSSAHVMLANALSALNGRIAAACGELVVAEAELRRAHSADPMHSVYALDLAELLLNQNRADDALDVIERTLATPQRDGLFEMRAGQQLERLRTQICDRNDTA